MALAGGRLAIGAGIWLAPGPTIRALGFEAPGAGMTALARLAGGRDLALGGLALAAAQAGDARARRATIALNAAVDAGDALAFGIAASGRQGIDRAAYRGLAAAIMATATGAWVYARS